LIFRKTIFPNNGDHLLKNPGRTPAIKASSKNSILNDAQKWHPVLAPSVFSFKDLRILDAYLRI
jgi:hypothetical protein